MFNIVAFFIIFVVDSCPMGTTFKRLKQRNLQ